MASKGAGLDSKLIEVKRKTPIDHSALWIRPLVLEVSKRLFSFDRIHFHFIHCSSYGTVQLEEISLFPPLTPFLSPLPLCIRLVLWF